MARKPNYRFERAERDRKTAEKKAAKLEAKTKRTDDKSEEGSPDGDASQLESDQS